MAESVSAVTIPPPIEIPAPDESLARRSGLGAGRGGGGGRAAASDAAANAGQVRWRILAGTRVERTQDGGANWSAATIEPELKTRLVGGTATSQTNCWIIGREGVVLVTTDGRTFRRVSLPEAVQLASIIAQDHLRATVTAIDGRTFTTIDGGLTWK